MHAQIDRQRAEFLDPLFDPDVPFSPMAQLLLTLALGAGEPEVTGLAVDARIVVIRDGRCVGPELGEVMGSLMAANESENYSFPPLPLPPHSISRQISCRCLCLCAKWDHTHLEILGRNSITT